MPDVDAERLLEVLRKAPDRAFELSELLSRAKITAKKEKEAKRALKGLVREGVIEREPGRRYRWSRAGQTVEGMVVIDRRGFPTFVPEGQDRKAPGIPFLEERPEEGDERGPSDAKAPLPSVDTLVHEDRVQVTLVSRGRRPRTYAQLLALIARPERRHVGLFRDIEGAFVVELDEAPNPVAGQTRRIREVLIPPGASMGAENGELVEVSFEPTDRSGRSAPLGRVVGVLGIPGTRTSEMHKLLIEHDLDRPFPPEVLAQADSYGDAPRKEDLEGRRDVRDLPLMTIDGATAKDFDDAVCAVRDGQGRYRVYVAIADVSHYVRMGTPLDEEAYRRGTSTYLTDRAIPMLPERLSNGLCSLNPNVDRLCMLAEMYVASNGRVIDARFSRAVMRSKARLTYEQVASALEGEVDEATQVVLPTLLLLSSVAGKLLERRLRRGSLDLDLPEPVVEFDAEGDPTTATRRPRNTAHRLIEDLMVATNEAAARYFLEKERDTLFRIHSPPDPDKMASFARLCHDLGVDAHISERPSPAEVSHLLSRLSDHPRGSALHSLLLRALSAARYAPDNEGHFGLASEAYLHFTSPIRRYPDLVVHRLMKQILDGGRPWYSHTHLERMGDDTSNAERKAMGAERSSMDLDRALIAQKHVGERLPGTVTGVQTFGLFVATLEPFLEGMVPVQTLPDDFYESDEHGSMLIGTRHGRRFGLGDPVEIIIHSVNLGRRQIELRPAPENKVTEVRPSSDDFGSPDAPRTSRLDPRALARKLRSPGRARGRPRGRGRGRGRSRGRGRR